MKMKKYVLRLVTGAAAAALLLSGCAAGEKSASEPSSASAGQTDAVTSATVKDSGTARAQIEAEAAALVHQNENGQIVLSHKYGETVMPEHPQRIVCIKLEDLALALGVDLTACQQLEGYYLEDQIQSLGIGSIAVDEESNTVNLEQVLSYEPDLILLRDSFEPSVYEELSKIAPVSAFDLKDTEVSLLAMGKALGMEQEALSRLEQYHQKLDDAKEALSAVSDNETAMLRVLKKEVRLYPASTNDMSRFLYQDLGLTPDPMAEEYDNKDSLAISMEMLPELTAEHIFLVAGYGTAGGSSDEEAKKRFEEMQQDPLWQEVPAVKKGNVYEVDSRLWLAHGILAVEQKVDDVLEHMTQESAQ